MKFLADENIDQQIVKALRDRGHEVLYVAEMERGVDDDFLSELANEEETVLITADKDFGEIVFRQGQVLCDGSPR
jgi:predicted nuclease of predicted toxin-antitoxin system